MCENGVLGPRWETNSCAENEDRSHTVITTSHPWASDTHFFRRDTSNDYVVHVGHSTRFAFLEPFEQMIVGEFVDCRQESPSLRQVARYTFTPDPRGSAA